MKNLFRTIFKIRQDRKTHPVTPLPNVGTSIVRGDIRIKMLQPCTPEVWDFLLMSGWRAPAVRKDRRSYVTLPHKDVISKLNAADATRRADVLKQLMAAK